MRWIEMRGAEWRPWKWRLRSETYSMSSLGAQWVKDLALSLQWLWLLLWCGFNPWSRNFLMPQVKKKKKKKIWDIFWMRGKSNHTAGHLKVGKQAFWYLDWDKGCRSHSPGSAWVKGMGAPRGVIDREQKERQLMVPCAVEGCMSKDLLYICQLRILVNGVHPNSHASCWSGLLPTKNGWNLFLPCFPPSSSLPSFLPLSFLQQQKSFENLLHGPE